MATISITQSRNITSETFRLSGVFDSETKKLKFQNLSLPMSYQQNSVRKEKRDLTETPRDKSVHTNADGKRVFAETPRDKSFHTNGDGKKVFTETPKSVHTNGDGKRVFTETPRDKSVHTNVDHLERGNRVNDQKRPKNDNVKPVTTTANVADVGKSGRFSSKDDRHCHRPATTANDDACGKYKKAIDHDAQMSPTKAKRAEMIKSRFADTILKATQQLLSNGEKGDSLKMEHKKELQKQLDAKKSQEVKLKLQREREREAARVALDMIVKTVEFHDCKEIMRDFEKLISSKQK